MKNADTITISILFCWPHLLFVSSDTNEWWRLIPFDNLNCVKTWSPVWNRHYVYNFCPGINGLISTLISLYMEKHIDSSHVIQELFFRKKGVNFNHYINLLKVRFKVYKMCTLKETSVRFLILMVRHHMQGYIYKFAKSSQVHFQFALNQINCMMVRQ